MQPSLTKRSDNLSRGNTKNDKDHPYIRAFECTFNYETSVYYQWPGVEAYFRYLEESCFEPLLADDYTALWPVICLPRPSSPAECWPWFSAVCSAVRTGGDKKSSIDDIWGLICNPGDNASNHASLRPAGQEKFAPLIAIFAVLCWSTMTLTPQLCWADFQSGPSLMVAQHQQQRPTQSRRASDQLQSLKMDIVRRPVPAVFRNFQRTMRTSRWRRPIGSGSRDGDISPVLHVSTLNYESLKTIGKIRLKWVNDLSSHLDFNAQDRSLSLFRFPTFCALNTLRESRGPVFDELTQALYCTDPEGTHESECGLQQISQEVLMSYRLIFGQRRAARQLAKTELRAAKALHRQQYDVFLDTLCTRPSAAIAASPLGRFPTLWPISCRSFADALQDESTYSARDDFPLLGARLARLQEFNLRQQPSQLRDIWRDRRNPLQWYTLWAVLILGGVSVLVALLQLLIGAAQLAVAIATIQA